MDQRGKRPHDENIYDAVHHFLVNYLFIKLNPTQITEKTSISLLISRPKDNREKNENTHIKHTWRDSFLRSPEWRGTVDGCYVKKLCSRKDYQKRLHGSLQKEKYLGFISGAWLYAKLKSWPFNYTWKVTNLFVITYNSLWKFFVVS